ncbi:unnamed protein product [Linum tenue]|uniref:S-protein homolog n=1 Tax=Linum tenue TaxID=586396 RepID=A0AAV0IF06_9ROSI|nr:unnamed protein product [Linum tenue]
MIPKALLAAVVLATVIRGFFGARIRVTNKLELEMAVIVHCASKDDDLRGQLLDFNATYEWRFERNFFGGTVFWCNLAFRDNRLSFTAYDQDNLSYILDYDVSSDGVSGEDIRTSGRQVHVCSWNRKVVAN